MIFSPLFHSWERRIHAATPDRVVRPFEWGLDWLDLPGDSGAPADAIARFVDRAMADTEAFYAVDPAPATELDRTNTLRFESAVRTPHPENNIVHARYFPAAES